MVWLDARGSFDRCHCPTRYILNVVNNNKSQVKRSVQLLPEEFGKALNLDISPFVRKPDSNTGASYIRPKVRDSNSRF